MDFLLNVTEGRTDVGRSRDAIASKNAVPLKTSLSPKEKLPTVLLHCLDDPEARDYIPQQEAVFTQVEEGMGLCYGAVLGGGPVTGSVT